MTAFSTPSSRWAALQTRNPLSANAFIYCVVTTKIYCRPTCSSRLARRANVIFHDTSAEAEAAGFRPCKRCRPNLRENEGDPQILAVKKACELIRREGDSDVKWSVKGLAKEVALTESHFCRVFKKIMGVTIGEYRMKCNSVVSGEDCSASDLVLGQATLQQLPLANLTFDHTSDIPFLSTEISTPGLCTSELLQHLQNPNSLQTPEDYPLDVSNTARANFHIYQSSFFDTWETVDDCFQFIDFSTPWPIVLDQEDSA